MVSATQARSGKERLQGRAEDTSSLLNQVATYGCESGVISSFIYYEDTKAFYTKHMESIEEFIDDYSQELGMSIELKQPRYNSAVWLVAEAVAGRVSERFEELYEEALDLQSEEQEEAQQPETAEEELSTPLIIDNRRSVNSEVLYDKSIGNNRLVIEPAFFPESPRKAANLWCFSFAHDRYSLGDEEYQLNSSEYENWEEYGNALKEEFSAMYLTPISMTDHSSLSFSVGVRNGWDSGQIGFAFTDEQHLKQHLGITPEEAKISPDLLQDLLRIELESYEQHLNGEEYQITVIDQSTGECTFSLTGFLGSDFEENGLSDHIPGEFKDDVVQSLPWHFPKETEQTAQTLEQKDSEQDLNVAIKKKNNKLKL